MARTIRWVQPKTENVKALWLLIKDGRFRNSNGVPKFQVTRGVRDPDEIIISWPYDNDAVVKCSIDDIPVYLKDEPEDQLTKILKRIARRDLKRSKLLDQMPTRADQCEKAKKIFDEKIDGTDLNAPSRALVNGLFSDTLKEMVACEMLTGQ